MNKSILTGVTFAFFSCALLTNCNSPEEKVTNAQNEVTQAKIDLEKANQEYIQDMQDFKSETAQKIAANEQNIVEFKSRIENEKKEAKAEYQKRIAELEQKNSDIKKKLDDYKLEGKDNWEKFKTEFKQDMDELGSAFKGFTVTKSK
ncbi:MAG: hypothetical protein WBO31_07035 [Saprospiraceae bacterium]